MTENTLEHKGTALFYRVYGQGRPVVLLHGFGEDGTIWKNQVGELEQHYKLIVPDLPGSGRSALIDGAVSIEAMVDPVKAILENEGIISCSMIGHSMGGYITLAFAEKHPDLLDSFGLFHSTAYPDGEEKKVTRLRNIDFIKKNGAAKFLKQAIPPLFYEEFKTAHPLIIKDLIEQHANFSPEALVSYTEAMMNRPDRVSVLKNFPRPVLFILGEHDVAVPLQQGLEQCRLPEFSYIYVCTHSGHMGMLEEPAFCTRAMLDFLPSMK